MGFCNTPCSDTSGGGQLVEVGVDTAKILIAAGCQTEHDRANELLGLRTKLDGLNGLQAGFIPGHGLIWVEGRFVQMVEPDSRALLHPEGLGDVTEKIRSVLADYKIGQRGVAKFSRLDITTTVEMAKPSDGFALLRGVRALDVPRRKTQLTEHHGRPETVSLITGKGAIKETVYDKGVERSYAAAGLLVRFEARGRFPKAVRETARTWTPEHCRDEFRWRFKEMAKSAQGVTAGSEPAVRELVRDFVEQGTITSRMAELLLGHIAAESVGIRTAKRTGERRRAELRRLGLALALDGDDESVAVDLGGVLDEVLTAGEW